MRQFFFGTFLVAAIVLISVLGTPVHAGEATPEAPSDVQSLGGVLSWSDNADNEDGFRVVIGIGPSLGQPDLELNFEFGPNTTSFVLPPEASIRCPDRTAISFRVTAFNEAGESEPAEISIQVLCPAPTVGTTVGPTMPPETEPTVLPGTGSLAQGDPHRPWLPGALAAGLALTLLAAGAGMLRLIRSPT